MGIFTSSTHSSLSGVDYASMIPATEGYNSTTGAAMAMLEVQQNDMAMFDAIITSDFNEVAAMNEGTYVGVINEGPKEILNKIIETFKKLLGKIKGIFEAFLAKLSVLGKKNKALYKDYSKKIAEQGGWKDFKCKIRKKKSNATAPTYTMTTEWNTESANAPHDLDWTKLEKSDGYDSDDIKEAILKTAITGIGSKIDSDMKNMESEYMDHMFEDEEEVDEWTLGDINVYGSYLDGADKVEKDIKKANDGLTKAISKIINSLEKIRSNATKSYVDKNSTSHTRQKVTATKENDSDNYNVGEGETSTITGDNYKSDLEGYSKRVSALQRIANAEQEVILKYTSTTMNTFKFELAQARKVWTSAAAYASTHNEGYEFWEAVGESYMYSFLSDMETV